MSKTLLLVVAAVVVFYFYSKKNSHPVSGGHAAVAPNQPGSTGATGQNTGDPAVATVITTVGNLVQHIYDSTVGGSAQPYADTYQPNTLVGYDENGLPIYE